MPKHSTNYNNAFIEIAEDNPLASGEVPPYNGEKKTVAYHQFEMLWDHPYKYTSDDIIFTVFAIRKLIPKNEWAEAREQFFSKGQPCFRASPLTKRYGWGIHSDANGKVAMYGADTKEYKKYVVDKKLEHTKAMRSKRN